MTSPAPAEDPQINQALEEDEQRTLKYSLLGPSLLKAGQDKVDQSKVSVVCEN